MNPDPSLDRLARFTPDAPALDPADLLFRAGRASARTPRVWKLAVAGLLLANAATVAALLTRAPIPPPPSPEPVPAAVPDTAPAPEPSPPSPRYEALSPWSLGALIGTTDPDQLPRPEPGGEPMPARPPLTAWQRGID